MTRAAYRLHRILQWAFALVSLFALANVFLKLGFFGDAAKGVLIGVMGLFIIYAAYFVPSLKDEREHLEKKEP